MTIVGPGVGAGYGGAATSPFVLEPDEVPGVVAHLDAAVVVTVGSDVSSWVDQLGPGHVWLQSTPSARPEHDTSGSAPLVVFDELSSEWMAGPSFNALLSNQPFTILIMASMQDTPPNPIMGQSRFSGSPYLWLRDWDAIHGSPGTTLTTLSYARETAMVPRTWMHDGSDFYYRQGSAELDRQAAPLLALSTNGSNIGTDEGTQYATMSVRDILIYGRALSEVEILGLENWARRRI